MNTEDIIINYREYFDLSDPLNCRVNAFSSMEKQGYCYINGKDFELSEDQKVDLSIIKNHFATLAVDQYDRSAGRYRQHGKYIFLPFIKLLIPQFSIHSSSYKQDTGFNDEVICEPRKFEPIPDGILSNHLLRSMVIHDYENSPLRNYALTVPMQVGIHFIRMQPKINSPSIPVPNRLHKDGEPCTWIHLINRVDVQGGENIITDNTKDNILCQITMNNSLDSIGLVDERVWHQVKPLYVEDKCNIGHRDVILIDFTPMLAVPNTPT